MGSKYRIALIGCGRISKNHFEAFEKLSDRLQIVAVCDIVPERAKQYADKYKVPYYTNHQDLVKKEQVDIVDICTPSGTHPTIGMAFARKQGLKAIVSEKPLAVDLNLAKDLDQVCSRHNVQLFVVKQNRLNPAMKLLKEAIAKKRFGKINMVNTRVYWQRTEDYYKQADWRSTRDADGGAFMNQASHYVDAIEWLLGPVKSVYARTEAMSAFGLRGNSANLKERYYFDHPVKNRLNDLLDKREIEDSGIVILNYDPNEELGKNTKSLSVLEVTMCAYPHNLEGSITILGEKGSAKIGGKSLNKVELWEFQSPDPMDQNLAQASTEPPNVYGFGHLNYLNNVLDILDKKSSLKETYTPDGKEGIRSLELLDKIYRSSLMHKEIYVGKRTLLEILSDKKHLWRIALMNLIKDTIDGLLNGILWVKRLFL